MSIQVSKALARALNEELAQREYEKIPTSIEVFHYTKIKATLYTPFCDIDYDENGYMVAQAIRVIYKAECYAMDKIITSTDLQCLGETKQKDYIIREIFEMVEV